MDIIVRLSFSILFFLNPLIPTIFGHEILSRFPVWVQSNFTLGKSCPSVVIQILGDICLNCH